MNSIKGLSYKAACTVKYISMAKHRLVLIFIGVALVAVASLPFLMSASCLTRPQTPGEQKALESLRSMTRNDVLPAENVVAEIENQVSANKSCRTGANAARANQTRSARFRWGRDRCWIQD